MMRFKASQPRQPWSNLICESPGKPFSMPRPSSGSDLPEDRRPCAKHSLHERHAENFAGVCINENIAVLKRRARGQGLIGIWLRRADI